MINAGVAFAVILGYLFYIVYKRRGALIFYSASRAASKKDYISAEKKLKNGYDKGWLLPLHEAVYAFLLLKRFGETQRAEKILKRTLNIPGLLNNDKNYTRLNLALVYFYKGELDAAIELGEEIYKEYKTTNFFASYGYFFIAGGQLEKALEINLEAYEFNNKNTVILDNLGQTYLLLEEYEKSEEIYKELMSLEPTFPEAYYNYGQLKEKLGDIDEAIYQMKTAMQKEFSYLTTIDGDMIRSNIERLYEEKDKNKEVLEDEKKEYQI